MLVYTPIFFKPLSHGLVNSEDNGADRVMDIAGFSCNMEILVLRARSAFGGFAL